ncbi:MAG: SDR family oxidoreductase [Deltaproteobacteria bacterium]|nr:SDR family oxidoreductase [Deltaproteobacteria bacterium]
MTTDTKNLVIFGATRGTGRRLLDLALAMGHRVTALVRDPTRLDLQHPNLRVLTGDATDSDDVMRAVTGQDAVLCALGAPALRKTSLRADSARLIVRAMETLGVRRLVSLSVLGVGSSHQLLPWHLKYLIFPLYLRKAVADHERQEAYIRESAVSWTIVRPPTLTDGEPTGDYRHGFADDDRTLELKVSRADVANFMMQQLDDSTYIRATPGISY